MIGGLVGLILLLVAASLCFKDQLAAFGRAFVLHFGLPGLFVGTFAADAFSFPVSPQFYLLTAVAARGPQVRAVTAIIMASILAGHAGYFLVQQVGARPFFRSRIERTQAGVNRLFSRYGYWAVALGSVTPIPYSVLCYAAGLYGVPYRIFSAFTLLRVPRILFFYFVIRAGWGLLGPG